MVWLVMLLAAAALHAGTRAGLRLPIGARGATFDTKSFLVGGRRVLLRSAGVHYFRIVPEEWADRLIQTRLAGFNMVATPVPWNLHEPARGTFRFDGIADLRGFLSQCHEQKLLVLLRIGPYVNAAVTNGGLPAWLGAEAKMRVRSSDRQFLAAVKAWWRRLMSVVLPLQVPRGPVAMIQIEDNYRGSQPGYLSRLYQEAEDLGIKVPVAVSTLHPLKGFGGVRVPDRSCFVTTELMPVGPRQWGDSLRAYHRFDDILFEGLAKGVDGYNHSMWAAGTSFELLPASSFPTRFECGTAGLLEGGALSEIHAACKKVNLFARAFQSVLTQASAVTDHPLLAQARRSGMVAYGRDDGTTMLLFVKRRYGSGVLPLRAEAAGIEAKLPVSASGFRHVVVDYPVTDKTRLAFSTAQVLAHERLGRKRLFVVYAPLRAEVMMAFRTPKEPAIRVGGEGLSWDAARKQVVLKWRPKTKKARADFVFHADVTIHVVAIEESLIAQTWVLDGAGVLVGAPGVGSWTGGANTEIELRLPARRSRFTASFYPAGSQRSVKKSPGVASGSYDDRARRIDVKIDLLASPPIPVSLRRWDTATELAEAAASYDDSRWASSAHPKPMGEAPYGWYRCTFRSARAGRQQIQFRNVADAVTVYLNGEFVGQSPTKRLVDAKRNFPHPASFDLPVQSGENVLAILAKNWGRYRNTASNDVELGKTTAWGILGDVLLGRRTLLRWRQKEGLSPKGRRLSWAALGETADARPRWYRATFPLRRHPARVVPRIVLKGLSHGALWVNGRFAGLYHQRGSDASRGYYVPRSWLRGQNEIIVFEEEGHHRPERAEVVYGRKGSLITLKVSFGP